MTLIASNADEIDNNPFETAGVQSQDNMGDAERRLRTNARAGDRFHERQIMIAHFDEAPDCNCDLDEVRP